MFAGSVKDTVSVYDNTSHYESAWLRTYVVGGTTIANTVGVRSLSDAFSEHDTIDAHVQSVGERMFDGITGGIGVVTTALPISAAATNALSHGIRIEYSCPEGWTGKFNQVRRSCWRDSKRGFFVCGSV